MCIRDRPLTNTRIITTSLAKDCRLNPGEGEVCVEEAIYTGIVTLPFNKNGYTLAYQRCCRNVILNNINDPLTTGVTYFSEVTTQGLLECNSQPVFEEFPEIFVCAGEKFTFTHGAVDPDGDELRYRFCIPSAGASIDNPNPQVPTTPPYPSITWANGFSTQNMFGPAGSITIDEATGMTMGTPDLVGTYLIGVCVDEFRDGVLISTTRRDFEYNVVSCFPPIVIDCEIRGNDCDGDNTISFVNRTTGANSYMWYFDFPNTDPSTTSTDPNPTHTYPVAGKYTIRKEAIRDVDGCSIFEEFVVSTGPSMLEPEFSAEFVSCDGGNQVRLTDLSVDPTGISCAIAWDWTIDLNGNQINLNGNSATFNAGTATTATVTLVVTSSSGCETTITRSVDLSEFFPTTSLETVLLNCDNGFLLQLLNSSNTNLASLSSTVWTITQDGVTTNPTGNPISINTQGGNITVNALSTFSNGCISEFTEQIDERQYLPIIDIVNTNPNGGNCVSSDIYTFSPVISGGTVGSPITSYLWTDSNGNTFTSENISIELAPGETIELELEVTYANGCVFSSIDNGSNGGIFTFTPAFVEDLTITPQVDCNSQGASTNVVLTDNTNNSSPIVFQEWTINGVPQNAASTLSFPVGSADVVITYNVEYANGCTASFTETFNGNTLIPTEQDAADISTNIVSCNGDQITVSISGGANSSNFNETWVINNMTFNGSPVTITVGLNDLIEIEHTLTSAIGCESSAREAFNAESLIPDVNITSNLNNADCINASGQTITLSSGVDGSTFAWIIDGQSFMTPNPQITVVPGQTVNASVDVILPSGCLTSGNNSFTVTNGSGAGDVTITNNRGTEQPCVGSNGESIVISANSTGQVSSYAWTCTLDGVAIPVSSVQTISVNILPNQELRCSVVITNADGCTSSATTQIISQAADQPVDVIERIDCSDPSEPQITLTYQQSIIGASSFEWTISNSISTETSNDASVTFPLSLATGVVNVTLEVTFDNGCTGTFNDSFDPSSLVPNLDYTATLIECADGQALYEFMFNDVELLCSTLESLIWTIDGQTFTGNPVQVWLPAPANIDDISVIATYSDGSVFGENITLPPLNTGLDVTSTTIGLSQTGSDCNGDVDLEVINPLPGVSYEWTDADGNVILVSGTMLSTNSNNVGDTILVSFSDNPNCVIGTGSIVIDNLVPPPAVDTSFIICPGDTSSINCVPADAALNLTYSWKPAEQLIGDADQPCPLVGIPESQTEDFSLVLCTTNQFGCQRSDTIDFMISTPVDGDFSFAPDSCGSFTYSFMAPDGVFGDGLMWDFGDGNTSTEINPVHTYGTEGEFVVTLDSDGVCLGDIAPMTLQVPAIPTIDVVLDTIMYTFGDTLELMANTNIDPDAVTWCNADGETIGMGNPLVYEPETSPETVFAKVEDEFGCTNQTMTVLISTTSLPPITTSAPEIACFEEEFPIELNLAGFDAEEFNFDWQPANCITTGQGTPSITAASSESKTFTVVVTNEETGQDTTITLNVDIEDLPIGIFTDNGIPDQEGLPQVCQGSEIDLSAEPFDPDCIYTWSTGETGESISVSPDENTTFSLSCTSPNGCEFNSSTDIEVLPPQCNENDVFVPNAFSPNADNVNDRLYVRSKFIREMEFFVTNRWGQEVWRTTDQQQGWDGNFEGEALAPDSYSYCLIVTCVNDETYTTRGSVSILK